MKPAEGLYPDRTRSASIQTPTVREGPPQGEALSVRLRTTGRWPLPRGRGSHLVTPERYTRNSAPSRLPSASDAPAIVTISSTIPHTPSAAAVSSPTLGFDAADQIALVIG